MSLLTTYLICAAATFAFVTPHYGLGTFGRFIGNVVIWLFLWPVLWALVVVEVIHDLRSART